MNAPDDTRPRSAEPEHLQVVLYRPAWRALAGTLRAVSGASLLVILASFTLTSRGPVNPLLLIRLVVGLCLLPRLAAHLLDWAFAARVTLRDGGLVVQERQRRVEIPVASVARCRAWRVPLPGTGLWLGLASGRRYPDGVRCEDPTRLVDLLVGGGAREEVGDAVRHPSMVYAHARALWRPASALGLLLKFPLFALVPTLPLFRVHQLIAYGGVFGEYYQYGLTAYLQGFGIYWASLTIYLMLYAAALRLPIEAVSAAAAVLAPAHAALVRRVAERVGAAAFYGGVPVALILRFLPW